MTGEAEQSQSRLDHVETKTVDLETIRLKNEIEIDNLRSEMEEMEVRVRIAEEKARNTLAEASLLSVVNNNKNRLMP